MSDNTIWFPVWFGIKSAPVKVICNCDGYSFLEKAGAVKSLNELPDEIPFNDDDLDTGGIQEGPEWDLIKDLDSKDEIEKIVKEKTGIDLDKRCSLPNLKSKALAALRGE